VIYELHVGTFTPEGTLDAAIGRLDYLAGLGVTTVELMPLAAFPGHHGWGYDGIGLWAVHEPYGGPDALKRFVDACHGRGLAVFLDVVYNHVGPGNRLADFGPYFTAAHMTPWGPAVNLDQAGSDDVRSFVIGNGRCGCDYHRRAALDAVRTRSRTVARASSRNPAVGWTPRGAAGRPLVWWPNPASTAADHIPEEDYGPRPWNDFSHQALAGHRRAANSAISARSAPSRKP
jgi:hypothetical protein